MMKNYFKNLKTLILIGFLFTGLSLNAQKTSVTQNDLPKTAQEFIAKNFNNQKVSSVIKDVEFKIKTEYEVYFENRIKIEFDNDGNWKEVDGNGTSLPTGFINPAIVNYANRNFPNEKIAQIEKHRSKYEVELTNGLDLEFSLKGDFLRIDD